MEEAGDGPAKGPSRDRVGRGRGGRPWCGEGRRRACRRRDLSPEKGSLGEFVTGSFEGVE